jgi:paired amphipathic helix protein Sin3a
MECQIFEKVKAFLDEGAFDEVMKCLFLYLEGVFNQYELFELIGPLFTSEDLLNQLRNLVASRDLSRRHHNFLCKPLSEFETHYFRKISYSYFEMPKDFPRSLCFGRTADKDYAELYKQVFNEDYSSLPQGSENFKFKIKNQYEDVLFRVEDEMYKLDYEIGNIHRTLVVLEEESKMIDKMTEEQKAQYRLDERKFNKLRKRQIEKVYGDMGKQMLIMLPQNPVKAIPILVSRFRTSYQKLLDERNEDVKSWKEQYEKNFYKSLDHRSFHFKSFEKK